MIVEQRLYRRFIETALLVALGHGLLVAPVQAGLFNGPVDRLPVAERVSLRQGKVVLTGDNGNYTARVLVDVAPELVWTVLTDYDRFADFLPGVVSSKVLETKTDGKIVEQVSQQQIFLFTIQSRIRYSTRETGQERIDFQLIDGDLASMEGFWLLEPVAPYPGAKPNQILVTHQVRAQPTDGTPRDAFNDIYRNVLADTMAALRDEMNRR
ncbi:MAG: SRPBCC family protein, partial [Cyanobacteria bacterium]|nr:SRPBCC family protein [Cyanobacteriota bacterium]MDW8201671.1 SRPBCC family protein [Cyanobacteriota bacterium SKYGB_h_bin112]